MIPHMGHRLDQRAPRLPGELIVRNGPDRGVSRGLIVPLTLVGSGESCDLRIIDPLVRPMHCVISVTPEGPHLRSVGGSTIVNDVPCTSRMLVEGDLLSIGDVLLEIRWGMPPGPLPANSAAGVPLAQAADEDETQADEPVDLPARKSARQQWRLIQERGRLFRDRRRLIEETNAQRGEIAEERARGENLRNEARRQLDDLRELRRRFLRRWKRQWETERKRIADESARLETERTTVEEAGRSFEANRVQNERDRRVLSASLRSCREKRRLMEAELESRRQQLDDREHLLNERDTSLRAEQAGFEQRRVELGHEIVALETRVRNLRDSMEPPGAMIPAPAASAVPDEEISLHILAEDLNDQRHSLGELVAHVARAVTDARSLSSDTLRDLEGILRNTLDREESLREQARHLLAEEARLAAWQARLLDSQLGQERSENSLVAREERVSRREARLDVLIRQWQRRRETELAQFEEQLARASGMGEQAREAVRRLEDRETEIDRRRGTLATRELALELARRELGESDSEALVRGERRALALQESREARLEEQFARLREAQGVLAGASRHTTEQWAALARQQRDFSRRQTQFDRRQYEADQEAGDQVAGLLEIQAARALAERHADELRRELSRLIKLTDQLTRGESENKRAA